MGDSGKEVAAEIIGAHGVRQGGRAERSSDRREGIGWCESPCEHGTREEPTEEHETDSAVSTPEEP